MNWRLDKLNLGEKKFIEYNDFTKTDIQRRLATSICHARNRHCMEFEKIFAKDGVVCIRIS